MNQRTIQFLFNLSVCALAVVVIVSIALLFGALLNVSMNNDLIVTISQVFTTLGTMLLAVATFSSLMKREK